MIIDAHHHCWDPTRRAYPWLIDPAFGPINRPYALDDFRAALNDQVPGALSTCHPPWLRIGLVPAPTAIRTILVQAMNDPAETVDLCAVAAGSNGLVAGVIGWADLSSPRLADQIADLRAGVGGALLVGLRHPVSRESDRQWLARPEVMRGLTIAAQAGLAFDLLISVDQLGTARQVARRLPEVTFVLDHLALPPIATGTWQPWAADLSALAELPNVNAKLSGLVTTDRWDDWHTEHLIPYTMFAFEAFGPERMMFGSDWPVCTLAASYPETLAVAEQCSAQLTAAQRRAFFSETARRVYGLTG